MAAGPILVQPAQADVTPDHHVIVAKDESVLEMDGFAANEQVLSQVLRNGVVVGTSTANADGSGVLEVNHAAESTICWEGATPRMLPGDVVRLTGAGFVDTVEIPDFFLTGGPTPGGPGEVIVTGHMNSEPRIPETDLNVFMRLRTATVPDVRFDAQPVYDDPTNPLGGTWTATFTGLSPAQVEAAMTPRVLEADYTRAANEIVVATPGPHDVASEDPACPGFSEYGVTHLNPTRINVANANSGLLVQGVSRGAASVDVSLKDGSGATSVTKSVKPQPDTGDQTWSVSFTAEQLSALSGTITVHNQHFFTEPNGDFAGQTRTFLKDVVAPAAPTITPNGGTFNNQVEVSIGNSEPGATYRYTTNGVDPTISTGTLYSGPFTLDAGGLTDLRAIAVDEADNPSTVSQTSFTVAKPPGLPADLVATPGNAEATLSWTEGPTNHAAITGYLVRATAPDETAVTFPLGPEATSHTFTGLANGKPWTLSVQASNAAGDGPTAFAPAVTPVGPPAAIARPSGQPRVGAVSVDWDEPSNNGSPITGYTVQWYAGRSATPAGSRSISDPSITNAVIRGLTNGQAYRFTVVAHNAAGAGAESVRSLALTPREKPLRPQIGSPSPGARGGALTATARWLAPAKNTAVVTKYEVRAYKLRRGRSAVLRGEAIVGARKRAKSMVLPRGNYRFAVRALSAVGNSPWSARSAKVQAR